MVFILSVIKPERKLRIRGPNNHNKKMGAKEPSRSDNRGTQMEANL